MSPIKEVAPYLYQVLPSLFPLELATAGAILLLAWFFSRRNTPLTSAFNRFARRRTTACVSVALFVLVTRAALLPIVPMPDPTVRDEFSHLFGAQTYAAGRVANPTHPMWVHFEAPYTIQKPTNVSAYPPGQALVLALGYVLGVHPWWAVWLSTGVLCGAICWALQGWLPPRWALFGAIVAALRYGLLSYWMNSYWGGTVPALGGTLALGALPRLRQGRASTAIVFTSGLALTVVARPYEGLLTALAISVVALWWLSRKPRTVYAFTWRQIAIPRVLGPAALIVFLSGAGMLHYCLRTTGRIELPYQVFIREYWAARHFIPMSLPPEREYRHDVFRAMAKVFREEHLEARSRRGFLKRNAARALFWWPFYCGPVLSIVMLLGWRALLDRRIRALLIAGFIFALGLSIEVPRMPHYAAPFTLAWIAVWVQAARHASVSRYGRGVVRLVPAALALVLVYRAGQLTAAPPTAHKMPSTHEVMNWCCVPTNAVVRAQIERDLRRQARGRHLVFFRVVQFRYFDWVYNKPDFDTTDIVWARAMSPEEDAALRAYYPDRRAWLVDATEEIPTIRPYPFETRRADASPAVSN
jgi:hypothetical protein